MKKWRTKNYKLHTVSRHSTSKLRSCDSMEFGTRNFFSSVTLRRHSIESNRCRAKVMNPFVSHLWINFPSTALLNMRYNNNYYHSGYRWCIFVVSQRARNAFHWFCRVRLWFTACKWKGFGQISVPDFIHELNSDRRSRFAWHCTFRSAGANTRKRKVYQTFGRRASTESDLSRKNCMNRTIFVKCEIRHLN